MTVSGIYENGMPELLAVHRGEGWSQPLSKAGEFRTPDLLYEVVAISEERTKVYECRICDPATGEMILEEPYRCRTLAEVVAWWARETGGEVPEELISGGSDGIHG